MILFVSLLQLHGLSQSASCRNVIPICREPELPEIPEEYILAMKSDRPDRKVRRHKYRTNKWEF